MLLTKIIKKSSQILKKMLLKNLKKFWQKSLKILDIFWKKWVWMIYVFLHNLIHSTVLNSPHIYELHVQLMILLLLLVHHVNVLLVLAQMNVLLIHFVGMIKPVTLFLYAAKDTLKLTGGFFNPPPKKKKRRFLGGYVFLD